MSQKSLLASEAPPICTVLADVDFKVLLYESIQSEGMCNEVLPGSVNDMQTVNVDTPATKRAKLSNRDPVILPSEDVAMPNKQSRQNKKQAHIRSENIIRNGYRASSISSQKYLSKASPIQTGLDTAKLPVAHGAYTALNKTSVLHTDASIDELQRDHGFKYIAVDPKNKKPMPIIDQNGLIIAYVAIPPDDALYERDTQDLVDILVEESKSDNFSKGELDHKRGDFPAVNFGWTLPNGFQHPINLNESCHHQKIGQIRQSAGFKQISGLQNGAFSFWNPGVYNYQKKRVEQVLADENDRPKLKQTTPKTVFPTTACNFRNVCCCPHRDSQNCPFSWCGITALGRFDHTRGGHLILWELKLIIEFPHGYTILIPSATITHSNTAVANGEIRMSITQYCAGSILRYADNLCHTDKALRQKNKSLYDQNQADKIKRWRMALGLLFTIDELRKKWRGHHIAKMFQ